MEITIRQTESQDYNYTENFTREIFWDLYTPGCTDHFILHNLRKGKGHIPELDLVVVQDGRIIGHIISSRAKVIDEENVEHELLCVGPFGISPTIQKIGLGTRLLEHSIDVARAMNYKGMILFGDPNYYHRFGFKDAGRYNITTKEGLNFPQFMALELQQNSLSSISGKFFDDEAFHVEESDFVEFDKRFPKREKGQPRFPITV